MRHLKRSILLLALTGITHTAAYADIVYKCVTNEGRKVYSGLPCGPDAVAEEYRVRQPARKAEEDLPPRQGELLNESPAPNSSDKKTEKSPE